MSGTGPGYQQADTSSRLPTPTPSPQDSIANYLLILPPPPAGWHQHQDSSQHAASQARAKPHPPTEGSCPRGTASQTTGWGQAVPPRLPTEGAKQSAQRAALGLLWCPEESVLLGPTGYSLHKTTSPRLENITQ